MKQVQSRVITPKPIDEVYAYLADFTNQPEWRFDVISCSLAAGTGGEPGAKYQQRVKPRGKEIGSEVELTRADEPTEVAFRTLDRGPVTVSGAWHLKSIGTGTEVICDVTIETRGFLRLLEFSMGPSLQKISDRYEQDLSARLNP
ncbi:SRPBCC family protein [Amycolatopsis umgeniensis]|uniref:Putative membrane protein n=1 Tax=Amycolatopsis umgeniensis TaxID=336628 RepID=A0A841B7V9_9PSEU|nr:SRPBCC family protein [Amycolatopsis umgeniensis]MBB5854970.1 putative membrane protein [Amycolatopsis umgeniensis]